MNSLSAPRFTLVRVRGIRLAIHWSWLIVFALVAWSLGAQMFPFAYPGLFPRAYWLMGASSALLFFVCIALHELGHAFQAEAEGMKIHDITLWLFGGVARFEGTFPSAAAEFRIAAAGPVVSVLLSGLFAAVWLGWEGAGGAVYLSAIADYLTKINLLLALFNLIPALPLDGGRILRAWMWKSTGSFFRATQLASGAGRAFAYALIGAGVFGLLRSSILQGAWFVVLGLFLRQAALSELRFATIRSSFTGRRAVDLMGEIDQAGYVALGSEGGSISADRPADEVVDRVLGRSGPVAVVADGAVVGQVSRSDLSEYLRRNPDRTNRRSRLLPRSSMWLLVAIALPIAATLYKPPVVVISPGTGIDISEDVTISGVETSSVDGSYLLVGVSLDRPNALRAALSALNPNVDLVPRSRFFPDGVSEDEFVQAQLEVFRQSRSMAAAAAAEAAGLPVGMTGKGALVNRVVPGSASDGKLLPGDIVRSVNGTRVSIFTDLSDETKNLPPGTQFDLGVLRGGRSFNVRVTSRDMGGFTSTNRGIGVLITTADLQVDLPFEVEYADRPIGGPSAGLVYGLVIADMLDSGDLAAGRTVAASGSIDLGGRIGPVGGLRQKVRTAEQSGASILLVPDSEVGQVDAEVEVVGVATLTEAIQALSPAA